jgi:prepilin-type N-terminal cleavage/methylation domain-containing protein
MSRQHKEGVERGFTLIELVLVVTILALMAGLVTVRLSDINLWKEEAAVRKLSDLVVLLNNQAVMDQSFYRLEFDLENRSYSVGAIRSESSIVAAQGGANLPPLALELAAMLSPNLGDESTVIPPPSYPSLAQPTILPGSMEFIDILTPRGKSMAGDKRDNPFLIFSPRGTSEFGVIHMALGPETPVTILVNPWTGMAEVYREYKEFQWTLGKGDNQ